MIEDKEDDPVAHSGKDILLDQLAACQDDESWYTPLTVAIEGLTAQQATRHDPGSTHSIWQIVNHLTYWNERWLRRFQGEQFESQSVLNDTTFHMGEQESWPAAIERLHNSLAAWRRALAESTEARLDELIPDFPVQAPWWGAIANLVTHNTYHIGQIVSIRKQHGNWRSDKG